mmetsp:Transcript_5469/g.15363  ORF Transcript_5469/g.15363 Transcript_5469/m.15363 type:complete len:338 (-) Transcript_5469:1578-2591(-)
MRMIADEVGASALIVFLSVSPSDSSSEPTPAMANVFKVNAPPFGSSPRFLAALSEATWSRSSPEPPAKASPSHHAPNDPMRGLSFSSRCNNVPDNRTGSERCSQPFASMRFAANEMCVRTPFRNKALAMAAAPYSPIAFSFKSNLCKVPWPTRPMATWAVPSSAKAHLAKTHRTKGAGTVGCLTGQGPSFFVGESTGTFLSVPSAFPTARPPSLPMRFRLRSSTSRPGASPRSSVAQRAPTPSPLNPFDAKLNFFRAPPPPPARIAPAKAQAPSSFKPWPSNRMSKSLTEVAACSATTWMTFFGGSPRCGAAGSKWYSPSILNVYEYDPGGSATIAS